jgi:hypothetical protein
MVRIHVGQPIPGEAPRSKHQAPEKHQTSITNPVVPGVWSLEPTACSGLQPGSNPVGGLFIEPDSTPPTPLFVFRRRGEGVTNTGAGNPYNVCSLFNRCKSAPPKNKKKMVVWFANFYKQATPLGF